MRKDLSPHQSGFTLLEMLVVVVFIFILSGSAMFQARNLNDSIQNQSAQVLGFVKQMRARAVSTTTAYLIYPSSTTHITVAKGASCPSPIPANPSTLLGGSFALDRLHFDLSEKVEFTAQTWALCFTPRGLAGGSQNIQLIDRDGKTKTVEIFVGGAARLR